MIENEDFPALKYDPDTGYFWWKYRTSSRCKMDKPAGTKDGRGYIEIWSNGKRYKAHRLAWFFFYGERPIEEIDHINGITDDNRIKNLREASRSENMCNTVKPKNNTSGVKCVYWDKSRKKWRAKIRKDGKYTSSYFTSIEKAEDWVIMVRDDIHKDFAKSQ